MHRTLVFIVSTSATSRLSYLLVYFILCARCFSAIFIPQKDQVHFIGLITLYYPQTELASYMIDDQSVNQQTCYQLH